MTITRDQLNAEIDSTLPTNDAGAISAANVRTVLHDMVTYTAQQEDAITDLELIVAGMQSVPPQAAAVGYNAATFSSTFTTAQVDKTASHASGFKFYPWNFFGGNTNLGAIILNSDTSLTLTGDTTGPNGELATIAQIGGGNFVGTAFGGGGYFEYVMKWNPANIPSSGTEALWSMAAEHLALMPQQNWPGQAPNFDHFIEVDVFENSNAFGSSNYNTQLRDYFGVSGSYTITDLGGEGARLPPGTPDFTQYHKYGFLWVPATASTLGYAKFYFDDVQLGIANTWAQYTNQPPPSLTPFFDIHGSTTADFAYPTVQCNHRQVLTTGVLGGSALTGYLTIVPRMSHGTIGPMWIGHAPNNTNPNPPVFSGNQVQVTWGGLPTFTQIVGLPTSSSDPIPFTYDPTKNLILSWYNPGTATIRYKSPSVGTTVYDTGIAGADESGATTPVQSYAPSVSETDFVTILTIDQYSSLSILDQQHLALVMGTGPGAPITVQSVKVWQKNNLSNWVR